MGNNNQYNFWNVYSSGWKNYTNFQDKATRTQYWTFTLVNSVISIILALFSYLLAIIFSIIIIIPAVTIGIRRIRDAGKDPLYYFWNLLPFIGWIIILVIYLSPTDYFIETDDEKELEIVQESIRKVEYEKGKYEYTVTLQYIDIENEKSLLKTAHTETESEAKEALYQIKQELIEEGYVFRENDEVSEKRQEEITIDSVTNKEKQEEKENINDKEKRVETLSSNGSQPMIVIGFICIVLNILAITGILYETEDNFIYAFAISVGYNIFAILGGILLYYAYKCKPTRKP